MNEGCPDGDFCIICDEHLSGVCGTCYGRMEKERDEARSEAAHFKRQLREAAEGRLEAREEVERLRAALEWMVKQPLDGEADEGAYFQTLARAALAGEVKP